MFKIVAFDYDRTIADTFSMCIKAFRNCVSPYIDHELSDDEILRAFGQNEIGMVEAAVKNFYYHYKSLHNEIRESFPGILELITHLSSKKIIITLITRNG